VVLTAVIAEVRMRVIARQLILETEAYLQLAEQLRPKAPSIQPPHQEADYWTCEARYQVIVPKSSPVAVGTTGAAATRTLRVEWGDGTFSDYPVPESGNEFELIPVSHVYVPALGRVYEQRAYLLGSEPALYGVSFTTHATSQYQTTVSGNFPVILPAVQSTTGGSTVTWQVLAQRNPDRDRTLIFYPDGAHEFWLAAPVPKGIGYVELAFSYSFSRSGCPGECQLTKVQHAFYQDTYTEVVPYTSPPYHIRDYSITYCDGCGPYT
ncbi:MAG: hypothetical protein ACRD1T_21340, partial [Acidimicrobiia bacterium]